jgi:Icc-related predicted phosphoesterase
MRIAAVGDIHGDESLPGVMASLERQGPLDLLLLAGDTTDRNDLDAFGRVLRGLRSRCDAPIWAVFGNNEYADSHPAYVERFGTRDGVRFLSDDADTFESNGTRVRIIGSTGSLDRPTWWQRKNLPQVDAEYRRRIETLDRLLAGSDTRILLTHYPPTYATMGEEKEAWRPELGCKALEPILLRQRPKLVIHGHIHKGIPFAELRLPRTSLEAFADDVGPVPIHNVAFPVRRDVARFDL